MGTPSEKHTQSIYISVCVRTCLSACRSGRKGAPSLSWEEEDREKSSRRCPGLTLSPHTEPAPHPFTQQDDGVWVGPFVSTAEGPEVYQLIPDSGEAGKVPLKIYLHP